MSQPIPWTGVRRVAVVPVFDRNVDAPPPADWEHQVRARMFYDPDPLTGLDRSFQAYLHALSYGRAFIDGDVFPAVWSNGPEVNIPAMNSLPAGHGYTHLVAVLPHSFGEHRGGHAFWDISPPVNGVTAWARVALYEDRALTVRQPIGVWGMEILHIVTEFPDLYFVNPNLGAYDVMAGAGASSHATTHTKRALGWLPQGRIAQHAGTTTTAKLHAIALPQPPAPDRVTAMRIPSRRSVNNFMVEARLAVDQYERSDKFGDGIPREGVIVYEVVNTASVFLRTPTALQPGGVYEHPEEGLRITVDAAIPGGFTITVKSRPSAECPQLREQIQLLLEELRIEEDPFVRRQLRATIAQLRARADRLGCPRTAGSAARATGVAEPPLVTTTDGTG